MTCYPQLSHMVVSLMTKCEIRIRITELIPVGLLVRYSSSF